VEGVEIKVLNSSNAVVRQFSSNAAVADIVLGKDHGHIYLPQGKYQVAYTYVMNGVAKTEKREITVPAPVFTGTVSVSGVTSYSLSKTDVNAANSYPADQIGSISASCTAISKISSEVLAQLPVEYSLTLDAAALASGTKTTSENIVVGNKTGLAPGQYTLTSVFSFDKVSVQKSVVCHITGLPYKAPAMVETDWKIASSTSMNCKYDNGTYQLGGVAGSGDASINSKMKFHIPENIPIKVNTNVTVRAYFYDGWLFDKWCETSFSLSVNGTTIITQHSNKQDNNNTSKNYSLSGTSTFTPSGSSIKKNSSYELAGPWSKVHSLEILYR
jgi:hypothetical protein